jgi:hypothetical protein
MLGKIVFSLNKLRHRFLVTRDKDKEMYDSKRIIVLLKHIGEANQCIHDRGNEVFQPLLTALAVPTQELHPHGETKHLSLFPKPPAKPREENKAKAMLEHAAAITLDDVDDLAKPTHMRSVADLLKTPLSAEELAIASEYGNPESTKYGIILHSGSRRKAHALPIWDFTRWVKETIAKDTTVLDEASKFYTFKDGHKGYKKVMNLKVPCPMCPESASAHMVLLRFDEIVPLMAILDPASARTYGPAPPLGGAGGGASAKVITSVDDFICQYNTARMSAARRDRTVNIFTCPKESCKQHHTPYIYKASPYCSDCCSTYRTGGVSHYHVFSCPTCEEEACGLCSRPKAEHTGETKVCPRAGRVSAADRAAARAEGKNVFCPCCDQAVSRVKDDGTLDGCPHLTCPLCREHFCANCEQLLPVDPRTGSRYVHECPNAGGDNHYFLHPAAVDFEVPVGAGRMAVEVNPARDHMIADQHHNPHYMPHGHPALGRHDAFGIGGWGAAAAAGGGGGRWRAAGGGGGGRWRAAGGGGGGRWDDDDDDDEERRRMWEDREERRHGRRHGWDW